MYGRALQLTAAVAILATGCAGPGAGPVPGEAGAPEEVWASLARTAVGSLLAELEALARTARLRAGGSLGES